MIWVLASRKILSPRCETYSLIFGSFSNVEAVYACRINLNAVLINNYSNEIFKNGGEDLTTN